MSKGIWFVFGLALSGLILTGTWMQAHRLAHGEKSRNRHRWSGTAAAIMVSLIVLVASVRDGFDEAKEYYGPAIDGIRTLPTLAPGVKVVIIGWSSLLVAIVLLWAALLWRPALAMQGLPILSGAPGMGKRVRPQV